VAVRGWVGILGFSAPEECVVMCDRLLSTPALTASLRGGAVTDPKCIPCATGMPDRTSSRSCPSLVAEQRGSPRMKLARVLDARAREVCQPGVPLHRAGSHPGARMATCRTIGIVATRRFFQGSAAGIVRRSPGVGFVLENPRSVQPHRVGAEVPWLPR